METNNRIDRSRFFFNLTIVELIIIMLVVVSIINNNSIRSSPVFLFILALGVGVASGLGLKRGGLFGLLLLSIWITAKQTMGVWSEVKLYLNLLEIALAIATFFVVGYYHEQLRAHFNEYRADKQKLRLLDLEDIAIGLIKPAIGLLRLKEETDRALRYRLPISFLLILVRPNPGTTWENRERLAVMRAAATTLKAATRAMDIPFLVSEGKIGLILPNTEINGTQKVINNILRKMTSTRVINHDGSSDLLQDHAQIRFGFGAFKGYSNEPVDLMEAAERSVQKNIESNAGDIFQNLFMDWEVLGETAASTTVLAPRTTTILETAGKNGGIKNAPSTKTTHIPDR